MKKKILVIDDNPVVARYAEHMFTAKGFEVIVAPDGASGLKKAVAGHPDLIFLDIILPEMHGFEVCKKIKEQETTKDIPIVIITGTGLEEIAVNEPDLGAVACLAKPFSVEDVDKVLKKIWPDGYGA